MCPGLLELRIQRFYSCIYINQRIKNCQKEWPWSKYSANRRRNRKRRQRKKKPTDRYPKSARSERICLKRVGIQCRTNGGCKEDKQSTLQAVGACEKAEIPFVQAKMSSWTANWREQVGSRPFAVAVPEIIQPSWGLLLARYSGRRVRVEEMGWRGRWCMC